MVLERDFWNKSLSRRLFLQGSKSHKIRRSGGSRSVWSCLRSLSLSLSLSLSISLLSLLGVLVPQTINHGSPCKYLNMESPSSFLGILPGPSPSFGYLIKPVSLLLFNPYQSTEITTRGSSSSPSLNGRKNIIYFFPGDQQRSISVVSLSFSLSHLSLSHTHTHTFFLYECLLTSLHFFQVSFSFSFTCQSVSLFLAPNEWLSLLLYSGLFHLFNSFAANYSPLHLPPPNQEMLLTLFFYM
ncbi:unnamed protein product [Acanthosepion pharaonis]|uniref:Uncharacterized protein n=1 Tax=Acanthosepion pharaonis TaxID=158019 RepID=A0A812BGQ8_ACAPH|nr:unnamed protein product [Sepia pharaonis]